MKNELYYAHTRMYVLLQIKKNSTFDLPTQNVINANLCLLISNVIITVARQINTRGINPRLMISRCALPSRVLCKLCFADNCWVIKFGATPKPMKDAEGTLAPRTQISLEPLYLGNIKG
jgi:hypothetical protein